MKLFEFFLQFLYYIYTNKVVENILFIETCFFFVVDLVQRKRKVKPKMFSNNIYNNALIILITRCEFPEYQSLLKFD